MISIAMVDNTIYIEQTEDLPTCFKNSVVIKELSAIKI